jgi:non-heme chloroperoxidase
LAVGESDEIIAKGLVLVDVVPRLEPSGVRRIHEFMRANINGFDSMEEVVGAVARYLPNRRRSPSAEGLRKNIRQGENGKLYWHWDPAFLTSDRRPDVANDLQRMQEAARNIQVPALVVRGELSDIVSQEGADEFLELIPMARVVEVEGAGHMVAGDKNDAFNTAVEDFLSELLKPALNQAGA